MAIVLYQVKTTIDKAKEDDFNRWYDDRHCPDLLSFRGCVSARRYRAIYGEDRYQYLAVYEFQDEPTFSRWMESEHRTRMIDEYRERWGEVQASRQAYVQIWPV